MSWNDRHSRSEELAAEAYLAHKGGEPEKAKELYKEAALMETGALDFLDIDSQKRTFGITAISATALWFKAGDFRQAQFLAHRCLGQQFLPNFAYKELQKLLEEIWQQEAFEAADIKFSGREVLVSIDGGEIVRGGAPLDLIQQKVQQVSSMIYRTIELLLGYPHRKRGVPSSRIRNEIKPWLFQTGPGSYQFAIRVQKPKQLGLFPEIDIDPDAISDRFLNILATAIEDPDQGLRDVVPDEDYRKTFLKLTRDLAPSGKIFSRMSIRTADLKEVQPIMLEKETRDEIQVILKTQFPKVEKEDVIETVQLDGILRALHLDDDWIEITIMEEGREKHIKITEAGDEVDDILGPMVNQKVSVEVAYTTKAEYRYRDIRLID